MVKKSDMIKYIQNIQIYILSNIAKTVRQNLRINQQYHRLKTLYKDVLCDEFSVCDMSIFLDLLCTV